MSIYRMVRLDDLSPLPDKEIFAACVRDSFGPLVQSISENCIAASHNAVRQLQQLYDVKDRQRQHETTKLREEITRLTVRLHKEESNTNKVQHHLASRNEYLARSHALILWRKYAGRQKEYRNLRDRFIKRRQTKIFQRYFFAWMKFHFADKSGRVQSIQTAKLDTITRTIITRYEEELVQVRSELSAAQEQITHGNTLRHQLEERMRHTLLQGMTAMNIETMALFNDTVTTPE